MNYAQTLSYLFDRLPMYQRIGAAALKPGLDNITALCALLHNPQEKLKCIHIAGTNGKGSTASMLASVLQESGLKVGLFTSPHLLDFRERIRINGKPIPEGQVCAFVANQQAAFEAVNASFFEYTTAMAFWYFEHEKVDVAIIEVGLGGRLDSTNILKPICSVITSISFDHTQFLGNTIEAIASEKAGIIKEHTPIILGINSQEVVGVCKKQAQQKQAPFFLASDFEDSTYEIELKGSYQQVNLKTVCCTLSVLRSIGFEIAEEHVQRGLKAVAKNTGLAGRWQVLANSPKIIADVAHNEDGIRWVSEQLQAENYENLHMVLGFVQDKELDRILALLPKQAQYYFCAAPTPRALAADKLQQEAQKKLLVGDFYSSVKNALKSAENQAGKNDLIFVGGSVFVVAEILS